MCKGKCKGSGKKFCAWMKKGFYEFRNTNPLITITFIIIIFTGTLSLIFVLNSNALAQEDDILPIKVEFENFLRIDGERKVGNYGSISWSFVANSSYYIKVYVSTSHDIYETNSEKANESYQKLLFKGHYNHYHDTYSPPHIDLWNIFFVNNEMDPVNLILDVEVKMRNGFDLAMETSFNMLKVMNEYFLVPIAAIFALSFTIDKFRKMKDNSQKNDSNQNVDNKQ